MPQHFREEKGTFVRPSNKIQEVIFFEIFNREHFREEKRVPEAKVSFQNITAIKEIQL
jgi:hypothetical protein